MCSLIFVLEISLLADATWIYSDQILKKNSFQGKGAHLLFFTIFHKTLCRSSKVKKQKNCTKLCKCNYLRLFSLVLKVPKLTQMSTHLRLKDTFDLTDAQQPPDAD